MNHTREFEERRAPRGVKRALSLGAALLFAIGLMVVPIFGSVAPGVLLFSAGAVLFGVRGYLNFGDKAAAGVLIFVAVVAVGIQLVVYLLGP